MEDSINFGTEMMPQISDNEFQKNDLTDNADMNFVPLTLHVREDLVRAFHRCKWLLVSESGQDQVAIMNEMVRDFLIKHGC